MSKYKVLWAKSTPFHPLWKHLLDAAAVSLELDIKMLSGSLSDKIVAFFVALHDIGKVDPVFQHQFSEQKQDLLDAGFPATADVRCRHEAISASFVEKYLRSAGWQNRLSNSISTAIRAHHSHWNTHHRGMLSPCPWG